MKTVIFFSASSPIPAIVSPTPSGGPEGSKSLHQLARDGDIEGCRTLKKLDFNCIFDKWQSVLVNTFYTNSPQTFSKLLFF